MQEILTPSNITGATGIIISFMAYQPQSRALEQAKNGDYRTAYSNSVNMVKYWISAYMLVLVAWIIK